jgi:transposase InsO family protein
MGTPRLRKFPFSWFISDYGSLFISKDFAHFLKFAGLAHISASVAYPRSNGKTCPSDRRVERFHRSISEECLRKVSLMDFQEVRRQVGKHIDFYNTKRLRSSLYYLTSEDFLLDLVNDKLAVREEKLQKAKLARKMRSNGP